MVNKLKVACLQIRAREYKDRDKNKENILKMVDKAAKLQPQLVVLPECAYPAYYLSPLMVKHPDEFYQSTLDLIAEIKGRAKKYKCYIVLGIVESNILYLKQNLGK
jgi:predicted amidohydrolase